MIGDDEEFNPGPSSSLLSIFDKPISEDDGINLTFTAPKQPKIKKKPNNVGIVDLILFKQVMAYKLENGDYKNEGQVGLAVLGNEKTKYYQILLYKDKNNHLCYAKITMHFRYMVQPNNYATFYDKHNQVWSVLFPNDDDSTQFSIQVALARYNSEENVGIISQDVWIPNDNNKGTLGKVGDTVQIHYTLFQQLKLNKIVSKDQKGEMYAKLDTMGWEQELLNMYKGMQRILIISYEKCGIWEKFLTKNSKLLFVKITTICVMNSLTNIGQLQQVKDKPSAEDKEPSNSEANVKARGESIQESLQSSPKTIKASLISRMARMGQATLPFKKSPVTPSDSDETEEESIHVKKLNIKPDVKPRTHSNQNQVENYSPSTTVISTPQSNWPNYVVNPIYQPITTSPNDAAFPVFFAEVRTHNSEVRMGITRVSDKVDNILSKLDAKVDAHETDGSLTSNMAKIYEENVCLKRLIEETNQKNKEILDILKSSEKKQSMYRTVNTYFNEKNDTELYVVSTEVQKELEKSRENSCVTMEKSDQEKINEELTILLKCKEDELTNVIASNKQLKEELEMAKLNLLSLKESNEQNIIDLKNKLIEAENDAQKFKAAYDTTELTSSLAEQQNMNKLKEQHLEFDLIRQKLEKQLLEKNEMLESQADVIKNYNTTIEGLKNKLFRNANKLDSSEEIKMVMNSLYRYLKKQIQFNSEYDGSFIHKVIGESIKEITIQYLQSGSSHKVVTNEEMINPPTSILLNDESELSTQVVGNLTSERPDDLPENKEISTDIKKNQQHILPTTVEENVHGDSNSPMLNINEENPKSVIKTEDSNSLKLEGTEDRNKPAVANDDSTDDFWQPQPPPPPLFDEDDDEDNWFTES